MVRKKHQSKRTTFKNKYKIQKKQREAAKKKRRDARRNPHKRRNLKKDPGLPKLAPFREQMLLKMERQRAKRERNNQKPVDGPKDNTGKTDMELLIEMQQEAASRGVDFVQQQIEDARAEDENTVDDNSKKNFFREFKKVVKASDVILQVLDARDPLGTRSVSIEREIIEQDPNKKIILVLNKIDLVPRENVEDWLTYLRNDLPAIAFKASTQNQRSNMSQAKLNMRSTTLTSECLGADTLIQLLKNYSRSLKIKKTIVVGIIGLPNVGKSSIINSLKRSRAVGVGATPGYTKIAQKIHLDSNLKLMDCPGILFSDNVSPEDAALRNVVKLEQIEDPILPIEAILKRCDRRTLLQLYRIADFPDTANFLVNVAVKRGKLLPGGVADINAAARIILLDWNTGKIPYYTLPPEIDHSSGASVVQEWGKEFNINEIVQIERNVLDVLQPGTDGYNVIPSSSVLEVESVYNTETLENPTVIGDIRNPVEQNRVVAEFSDANNPQINQVLRKDNKTLNRKERKEQPDKMETEEDDQFDFGQDFWSSGDVVVMDEEEVDEFAF
eukprot:TRINITY_DN9452_c0_g1_i1.p1 TRINITY_DN9452_c0_g1~~TRINITY_DN9452_c0_g1_i1.p1  ORF type:complete len:557 (-),score=166.82 TRINITY_DN9452_c0_g1_i1:108-1778(-)